ncbi:hypothetical protein KOW79_003047 [Hemibagrus wyckioides]|uniref:Uncharacterized protein n=1 Tax=Hemibagrus wyckioides TaxID=337641 RepID=A0A9D3P5L2_9TELE|nr:hypothetical protein KOW79_003047 [Hemibagrus wyckioides]
MTSSRRVKSLGPSSGGGGDGFPKVMYLSWRESVFPRGPVLHLHLSTGLLLLLSGLKRSDSAEKAGRQPSVLSSSSIIALIKGLNQPLVSSQLQSLKQQLLALADDVEDGDLSPKPLTAFLRASLD